VKPSEPLAVGDDGDPRVGTEVGSYSIVRVVGRGGMGAVYEARHTRLGRRFAIKFLLPELAARPDILRRFENEAVAAGGLEHPNLVAVTDLGRAADGAPFIVMEFLDGEDFSHLLDRLGPLPAPRAADLILQACRGLAVAHDGGTIHRDLKPGNLFLTPAGDGRDVVKVLDFGIAKLRPGEARVSEVRAGASDAAPKAGTRTGATLGTANYMSPEQARGASEVDVRSDVWSLGVVLYELLAGRKPFEGDDVLNVVHQILSTEAPPLAQVRPGLPAGLEAVVRRAMHKDPAERFQRVAALAEALQPFATRAATPRAVSSPTAVTMESPAVAGAEAAAAVRAPRWARVGTVLAMSVAVVGILVFVSRGQRQPAEPPSEVELRRSDMPASPRVVAPPPPPAVAPPPAPAAPERAEAPPTERKRPDGAQRARASSDPTHAAGRKAPALSLEPNPY
jgi:serine/threonine-protein kinase